MEVPSPRRKTTRVGWTEGEDSALRYVMQQINFASWEEVAFLVSTISGEGVRDANQVNQHWRRVLQPKVDPRPQVTDELLMLYYAIHGKHWSRIAENFNGAISDVQIRYRIEKMIRSGKIKCHHAK